MNIKKSFILQDQPILKDPTETITDSNRIPMWLEVTGAGMLMEDNPNYYSILKASRKSGESKAVKQIQKDLNRTFPSDKTLDKQKLKNILVTYSYRNPNVGYCQGLNFVVALLLTFGLTEEQAFWVYVQIIEKYLPLDFFTSMSGVLLSQKVFDFVFRLRLQKVCRHMERLGVESGLFTVQWFICIFSFTFEKEIVCQLWDFFFCNGYSAIFQIGLSALWILRKDILMTKDFVQILECVEHGCKSITDFSLFTQAFSQKNLRVQAGLITRLSKEFESEVINEFNERFQGPEKIEFEDLIKSIDKGCRSDSECKQKIVATSGYFTLKESEILVVEGFIDNNSYPKILNAVYLRENQDVYLNGVKNHCCQLDSDIYDISDDETEDITFVKRTMAVSVKKSFAQISNKINLREYE